LKIEKDFGKENPDLGYIMEVANAYDNICISNYFENY